jgi:AcrR family transcriptional regulator
MIDSVNGSQNDSGGEDVDLKRRLVGAALDELAGTPASKLSVRRVADRVGVSHQAPYVHFGNRQTFLAAVAGVGLAAAAARAREALDAVGRDPRVRLHALADAYVEFIRSEPHIHDLAYGPLVAMSDHVWLQAAAAEYWGLVMGTVAACQPSGVSEGEILNRCTAVWGLVYGIARLDIHRKIPSAVPGDPIVLIHGALDSLLDGWHAPGEPFGPGGLQVPAWS